MSTRPPDVLGKMIGFVTTRDAAQAKAFYGDALGFRLVSDDQYAVVFDANGTMLRVAKGAADPPVRHTVLGWEVADIHASIRTLVARGVKFEQFGLAFLPQDEHGVWSPPEGGKVAWFKDPDGNVLSISQHAGTR